MSSFFSKPRQVAGEQVRGQTDTSLLTALNGTHRRHQDRLRFLRIAPIACVDIIDRFACAGTNLRLQPLTEIELADVALRLAIPTSGTVHGGAPKTPRRARQTTSGSWCRSFTVATSRTFKRVITPPRTRIKLDDRHDRREGQRPQGGIPGGRVRARRAGPTRPCAVARRCR
jgi:hypothetical protein